LTAQWIFKEFHVTVLYVVTPCSEMIGYRRFGGSCCFHLLYGVTT